MAPISQHRDSHQPAVLIGWREWISLPDLGITQIKVKVDTGARTSALHAYAVEYFDAGDRPMVTFHVHPLQRDTSLTLQATAPVLEMRHIRNSGGETQERPVIQTTLAMGADRWPIELTLTNRDVMGFRMLLGREAIRRRFLVDPGNSYLLSKPGRKQTRPSRLDRAERP